MSSLRSVCLGDHRGFKVGNSRTAHQMAPLLAASFATHLSSSLKVNGIGPRTVSLPRIFFAIGHCHMPIRSDSPGSHKPWGSRNRAPKLLPVYLTDTQSKGGGARDSPTPPVQGHSDSPDSQINNQTLATGGPPSALAPLEPPYLASPHHATTAAEPVFSSSRQAALLSRG